MIQEAEEQGKNENDTYLLNIIRYATEVQYNNKIRLYLVFAMDGSREEFDLNSRLACNNKNLELLFSLNKINPKEEPLSILGVTYNGYIECNDIETSNIKLFEFMGQGFKESICKKDSDIGGKTYYKIDVISSTNHNNIITQTKFYNTVILLERGEFIKIVRDMNNMRNNNHLVSDLVIEDVNNILNDGHPVSEIVVRDMNNMQNNNYPVSELLYKQNKYLVRAIVVVVIIIILIIN